MSTKDPNLKVIFGADTKDFDKGAKAVKQGLSDLDKSTGSMLSSLSNAFGVSSGKVEQMTSAIRGLGYRLVDTGNEGAKAFGSMLAKIGPLQAGIAGLGLAGAIAGFKALKAEAENFKSTIDGMNMSMATSAYISTYKQVLHDANSETGKAVAEAMNAWEKGLGRFKANLSSTFVTAVGQDQKWYDAISPSGLIRAWQTATSNQRNAEAAAERNEARQNQITDLKKRELTLTTEVMENEAKIAEYRRQAVDSRNDPSKRAEAEAAARALITKNYEDQKTLATQIADLQIAMDREAGNTFEETKHTEELKQRTLQLDRQQQEALQSLDKVQNRITSSAEKEASARQKAKDEAVAAAAVYSKWSSLAGADLSGLSSIQGSVAGPSLSILPRPEDAEIFKETFLAQLGDIKVAVGFETNTESIKDITSEVTSLLEGTVTRAGEILGNLIGTLAAGGDAWGDFKNAAVSAFGDMAIAVGKIAVSAGVATLGIKAAFESLNGYAAIAAGAALIALGAAVKSSLSAVASGDYSAGGGGGYSGGYSSGTSNDWEAREVKVEVTGELVANGDQLQIAINNANKKRYITG